MSDVRIEYVYVKHPLSKDQKAGIRAAFPGTRIVDARYAGKGDKIYDADGKVLTKTKAKAE